MIIRPNAGHILLPRRFVDVGTPRSRVGMSGRYQLVKRDAWGTELERTPWFDNIILDSGLNRLGTAAAILGAAIGTGTSTPTAADTGLQTETHYTTTVGSGAGIVAGVSPNYNNTRTYSFRTTLGALNGNYTEVGVGWASGSNMFSRALILDGGGSPTTISVTSSQILEIIYQLSVYPPLVDFTDTLTISTVSYDIVGRAATVTNSGASWAVRADTLFELRAGFGFGVAYSGSIGAITSSPSGSSASNDGVSVTNDTYSNNSLTRSGTHLAGINNWNVGGVGATLIVWGGVGSGGWAAFQYGFTPVIPKDDTKTLALSYSITWARR